MPLRLVAPIRERQQTDAVARGSKAIRGKQRCNKVLIGDTHVAVALARRCGVARALQAAQSTILIKQKQYKLLPQFAPPHPSL